MEQSGDPPIKHGYHRYAILLRLADVHHPYPYYEPKMWTYRHLLPVFILITLVEMFLATEHVLEEVYLEEVMHYGTMTSVQLDWPVLAGGLAGCPVAYWWMHIRRVNYLRLIVIGLGEIIGYLL